jgi:hypothetical protein
LSALTTETGGVSAPNNGTNAFTITPTSGSTSYVNSTLVTVTPSTVYNASVYLKYRTSTNVRFRIMSGSLLTNSSHVYVNFTTSGSASLGTNIGVVGVPSLLPVTNG